MSADLKEKKKGIIQQTFIMIIALVMLSAATIAWFFNNTAAETEILSFKTESPQSGIGYGIYLLESSYPSTEGTWRPVAKVDFMPEVPNAVYRYKVEMRDTRPGDYSVFINFEYGEMDSEKKARLIEMFTGLYIHIVDPAIPAGSLCPGDPFTSYDDVTIGASDVAAHIFCMGADGGYSSLTADGLTDTVTFPVSEDLVNGTTFYFDLYMHKDISPEHEKLLTTGDILIQ